MNKLFKYLGCALSLAFTMTACSPDEFTGADPNGLPTMDGRSIVVETDQETNTAVFSVTGDMKGCYPVWYLDGKIYSLLPKTSYSNMSEGTHTLEVRMMNRNGMSQGSLTDGFTFNETKVDYTQYFKKLCDKEWRIDYAEAGHMGCGEPGTDGSNWWSAGVNDKADWGVYDDRITFTHSDSDPVDGGSYTYNPGEGGTVYINKGCSLYSEYKTEDADYMAPVSEQTTTFTLIPGTWGEDDCLYIQFPTHTLLPYIPNDDMWENPYYRVEALTNTRLALVIDNGEIAWRLVFTSREDTGLPDEDEDDGATMDWNYDAATNLWKPVDVGPAFLSVEPYFTPASDWNGGLTGDFSYTHESGSDVWSLALPEGIGPEQWKGQFKLHTSLTASMSKKYNFYCVVEAEDDCPGVTIKLTEDDEDNGKKHDDNYFVADRHDIKGGTPFVYKAEGVSLPKNDAHALLLVLDFGGCPATNVKISKIYFEEDKSVSYDDAANLWKAVDEGSAFLSVEPYFTPASDWNGGLTGDFSYTHESGSNVWSLDLPEGIGPEQWKGQFKLHTTLATAMADSYYFSCTIEAEDDCPGVTIKLTEDDEDNGKKHDDNYYFADRHDIKAGTPYVYKVSGVTLPKNNAHAILLVLDFGGCPATNVKVSNITFAKQ